MADILKKVLNKIDSQWDEQISFLQEISRYPSTFGNEAPVQEFIKSKFEKMKLETDIFDVDLQKINNHPSFSPVNWTYENRPNVVGRLNSGTPKIGKSLILQGHIDVVSPEPLKQWNYDPWGAEIDDGRMYGRGVCDMKAGIAAMFYAVQAIQDCGIQLGADVVLESVIEEECTGNGALATLLNGYDADGGIIPEPTALGTWDAQVGVIWMQIKVRGLSSHVAESSKSVNAIEKCYVIIEALQEYHKLVNSRPKPSAYKDIENPLNVNVGKIQAGDWPSTVPSECIIECRIGFYPDLDPVDVKKELEVFLMKAVSKDQWLKNNPPEITFYGFNAHGLFLDREMEIIKAMERNHEKILKNKLHYSPSTATTDIRFYNLFFDIPTICYGPLGGNIHAPDEWVDLESTRSCSKVLSALILDWCGVK